MFLLHRGEGKNRKTADAPAREENAPKTGLPSGGARHQSWRADHLGEAPSNRKNSPSFTQRSNILLSFLPFKGQQSVRSVLDRTAIFRPLRARRRKHPKRQLYCISILEVRENEWAPQVAKRPTTFHRISAASTTRAVYTPVKAGERKEKVGHFRREVERFSFLLPHFHRRLRVSCSLRARAYTHSASFLIFAFTAA